MIGVDTTDMDHVIRTPHMVGHSRELMAAISPTAAENALRILRGELPLYVKNPEGLEAWQKRLAQLPQRAGARCRERRARTWPLASWPSQRLPAVNEPSQA